MTKRKLEERSCSIGDTQEVTDLKDELQKEIGNGKYRYLLAHLDDGVIWGRVEGKTLHLSSQVFPEVSSKKLDAKKLWELRLFGNEAEWHVWRADGKLFSCLVKDGKGDAATSFDEEYILWGTVPDGAPQNGFQLVAESNLGILHTPPAEIKKGERHNLRLIARHYVAHDECGAAYVKLSRLVDLQNRGAK